MRIPSIFKLAAAMGTIGWGVIWFEYWLDLSHAASTRMFTLTNCTYQSIGLAMILAFMIWWDWHKSKWEN